MKLRRVGFFKELEHGENDGGSLVLSRGLLGAGLRERVAKYLEEGAVISTAGILVDDWFDPSHKKRVAPLDVRSDGTWLWPGDLAYYVRQYGVGLPEEFLKDVSDGDFNAPRLSDEEVVALADDLYK